jgi:hypothetical protein
VLSVQMRWKGDPVIDFLVRYETQNGTRIIKVFADGSLILTYPGAEFTSGYCRFFLNNAVCAASCTKRPSGRCWTWSRCEPTR